MSIYNRILLALDLSSNTDLLSHKAKQLADLHQAELLLLHVHEPIMTDSTFDTLPALPADFEDSLLNSVRERLQHIAVDLGIEPERVFLEIGETRREIMRVAEQQQVTLIVIGSHGRNGVALLLGSTANAVLHHAKCDVLAVRITN